MRVNHTKPDTEAPLKGLKDFQRRTVDYVFQRLYRDNVRRFLVADEVGLGKTLVARGVVARTIDHLWSSLKEIKRIDIIYVCSNGDIARQNINRLNVFDTDQEEGKEERRDFATRLTLLPLNVGDLDRNPVNFVAFTPGTSFNLGSSGGIALERTLLYYLLHKAWRFGDSTIPMNIFQYGIQDHRAWRYRLTTFRGKVEAGTTAVDKKLHKAFLENLGKQPEVKKLYRRLTKVFTRANSRVGPEDRARQRKLIGTLRRILAKACVDRLEPDLIILDEFQRFRDLLDRSEDNEAAQLAQALISYRDEYTDPRVLLLSATPYKPYTVYDEADIDDHYQDFIRTVGFLFNSDVETEAFKQELRRYREGLLGLKDGGDVQIAVAKQAIERRLRRVMVRTERLSIAADRNGMFQEVEDGDWHLGPQDLHGFVVVDRVSKALESGDTVEYWKSAPYILNTMDRTGYKIKRDLFRATKETAGSEDELIQALLDGKDGLLDWKAIEAYREVDPGNARVRCLIKESLDKGAWKFLWVPPSVPYYQVDKGPYANETLRDFTKTLIFSSWQIVPKVIAVLCSYQAERKMTQKLASRQHSSWSSYSRDYERQNRLLDFQIKEGQPAQMNSMVLLYPCLTLAEMVDPAVLAAETTANGFPPTLRQIEAEISTRIEKLLEPLVSRYGRIGRRDPSWYWSSLALLDRQHKREESGTWICTEHEELQWRDMVLAGDDRAVGFTKYVDEFQSMFELPSGLGEPPKDLVDVLTKVALGSPAVTVLRSFFRTVPPGTLKQHSASLLANAARVALGFRSLFNLPSTIVMLRTRLEDEGAGYWKRVLDYCVNGNVQTVLDEYVHLLLESHGLLDKKPEDMLDELAAAIRAAVSIRTVPLNIDEIDVSSATGQISLRDSLRKHTMRCRYAMRFGDGRGERVTADDTGETRKEQVREAFNSPFWPFVLATTSIGQEGLDFHQYCHNVFHWNLPSNPVDLEQREGRVHRYKGHAVRRNVAEAYPLGMLRDQVSKFADPLAIMFELAHNDARASGARDDLVPFWVFPRGRHKITRRMMLYPLSRDAEQLARLKKGLVSYRLVLGQPRQEDLLEYIHNHLEGQMDFDALSKYLIDLSPPSTVQPNDMR